jgi:hypothetical protein
VDRREHAGGAPKAERSGDQWVPTCDFPYEVIDGFAEEEPLYPMEKFSSALREIAGWMVNEGKFQERGVTDRAMVFAWMIAPDVMNCSTQAQLAERMNLSRSQVNFYVKEFTERFGFVSGSTYTERQRKCRKK